MKKIEKNNLDEIFTSKNNQFEGDDGDYLKNFRLKKGFSETENENSKMNNRNNIININVNNINNNLSNNFNMLESVSKTEPLAPKFDTNLSRISSGNNVGNNSEYDIINSISSNK